MAVQSAAVGTVSPGDRSRSVRSASVTTVIATSTGPAAVAPRLAEPISQPATAERRAQGRADHVLALGHLSAAKLLTPANEGDPMAATALTPHRVNHLIPPGTEEPR